MPWRCILTVISPLQDIACLQNPAAVATRAGADLQVLIVGTVPTISASPYDLGATEMWAAEAQRLHAQAKAKAEEVEAWMAENDIKGEIAWEVTDDSNTTDTVAQYARYTDMVLIGDGAGEAGLQRQALDGALFHSGRPVIVKPAEDLDLNAPGSIVIAWNAGLEAAKAVQAALPVLKAAQTVHVMMVDPRPSSDGPGPEPGANIGHFLARHGVNVQIDLLPDQGIEIAEILNRHMRDTGASLVVMGGYGHSRLRERILGGTTQDMVENSPYPMFMIH